MTTVLSVHNSDGCVGRCDANCHDATSPDCDCICGGRNHGVGLQRAIENNYAEFLGVKALDEYARKRGIAVDDLSLEQLLL